MKKIQYASYHWLMENRVEINIFLQEIFSDESFTFDSFYVEVQKKFSSNMSLKILREKYTSEELFKKELKKGFNQCLKIFKFSSFQMGNQIVLYTKNSENIREKISDERNHKKQRVDG